MPALEGLRVLDLGVGVAAPYCARLLADYGADVVKVEAPEGEGAWARTSDGTDATAVDRTTAEFGYLNQSKRAISLRLDTEAGRKVFEALVAQTDVIVESFEPGALEAIGLGYDRLAAVNPAIILVSITPFGQHGPYRDRPATNLTVAALGGWLRTLGQPDREPLNVGVPVLDYVAGVFGAVGALASLTTSQSDRRGQHVDISIQGVALRMLPYPSVATSVGSWTPTHRRLPFPMYTRARDGFVAVNALSAQHWRDACLLMELTDVADDWELAASPPRRAAAAPELQKRVDAWAADKTREEIFLAGQLRRVPTGLPYSPLDIVASAEYRLRGFLREAAHPDLLGIVEPARLFVSVSARSQRFPAPERGQHNADVLPAVGSDVDEPGGTR